MNLLCKGENFMGKKFNEKFKNWPIKKKLTVSHGSIIVMTFVLIVILLLGLKLIAGSVVALLEGPTTSSYYVGDIRVGLADNQRCVNRAIAIGENVVAEEEAKLEANFVMMKEAHDIIEKTLLTKQSKATLNEIWKALEQEQEYRIELVALMKKKDFDEVNTYDETYYTPLLKSIEVLADRLDEEIYAEGEAYAKKSTAVATIMILLGFAMLGAVIAYAINITRKATVGIVDPVKQLEEASKSLYAGDMSASKNITYYSEDELGVLADSLRGSMDTLKDWVQEISQTLSEIAQGDLTKPFTEISDFRGDFRSIKKSFVLILESFNETLSTILESVQQVDVGSDEIAKSSTELANGTTDQASAVEELTATIETVAQAAKESAKQTDDAYNAVMNAVEDAQKDREQVALLQAEMQKIKDISGEIQNIIVTIEDIASQTSLLSLNASIEAARAGEAGRGFAVVAEQIGKLAQDSAQATVSTRELIDATVREIDNGNEITLTTVEAFEKIIDELNSFAEMTNVVKESSTGAADAMQEIENGIEQISGVTQMNAAASEESAAVAEELAAKATELDSLVRKFKLFG